MTGKDPLPPLREVIATHGLRAKKNLGQNFILDLNVTDRIARLADPLAGSTVIEIGPGPGGLTRSLLNQGADKVVAIERDDRTRPALAEISTAYPGRMHVIEDDALNVDYQALIAAHTRNGQPARIVANLPYSIATPLLTNWLTMPWPPAWDRLVLMFQKEVAERIVSAPGSRSYGRLAILSQWRARATIALTLPPQAFTPPPKVESAVVVFEPTEVPTPTVIVSELETVTAAAFGQRRKMLRSALKRLAKERGIEPEHWLDRSGVDECARAETLSVQDFLRLTAELPPG